jgi:hypothetical protein
MWKKLLYPVLGWAMAMGLHAVHNGGTVLADATSGLSCVLGSLVDWLGVLAVLILILVVTRRERRWFQELEAEVASGIVTPEEVQLASQPRLRFSRGWQILSRHGLRAWFKWSRYVQMIVDLAYKKHQKRVAGEGIKTDQLIAELRQRIARTRPQLPRREP